MDSCLPDHSMQPQAAVLHRREGRFGRVLGPGPETRLEWALAARDGRDHEDLRVLAQGRVQTGAAADVFLVDVDVDEPSELAVLVEAQVAHRERAQSVAKRRSVDLELAPIAGLAGEQRGEPDYGHSAVSTERIGGSQRAASLQDSPPSPDASSDPLCVPK